ncbi:hypothetical protein ACOI1H_21860 [Loktanella sp. DJP18]|uniref:hypothetical protein n=1 Tax=Loktanella sp. DJP18 TaxID=3409788 RepID=UPI003BB792E4
MREAKDLTVQRFPGYKVAHGDLERILQIGDRIFPPSVSRSHRLGMIGRAAGFHGEADFLDTLKYQSVMLWDLRCESELLRAVKLDGAGSLYFSDIHLNSLVSAGLAWGDHFDAQGGGVSDFLRFMDAFRHTSVLCDRFAYKTSLTPAEIRDPSPLLSYRDHFRGDTVILVSPRNQRELCYDFDLEAVRELPVGCWIGCRVHLTAQDRFFIEPDEVFVIDWENAAETARILEEARIVCFDDDDSNEIVSLMWCNDLMIAIPSIATIKADAFEIGFETNGDFFSIGHASLWQNERPDDFLTWSVARRARFSVSWMCEMVNYVQGCCYELVRLKSKPVPAHLGRQIVLV